MAPAFQAAGIPFVSTGSSVNVPWPTHLANDIGLIIIETAGDSTALTPAAGWAALPGTPVIDVATSAGSKLHVWWKRAASSAEANVTTGATTNHILAQIFTFRGCSATGNPWDVITTGTKTTASIDATVPALTTTVDDTLITMIVGRPNDSSSGTQFGIPVNINLTSIAEQAEAGTTFGSGGGFVVSTGIKSLAGNTGTSTLTKTASTTDTYVVLALKTGAAATYELITTVGSFVLSGTTTGLLKNNILNNTLSTFTFTGNNLILSPTVVLNTTVSAFNLTGNNADLTYTPAAGLELVCQLGSFTWTGISSILTQQLILNNTAGSFDVNGLPLNQQRLFSLNGNTESFLVNGKFISLLLGKNLNTTTGTFVLNGINLDSAFTYAIIGSTRSFLIGFNPADVAKNFQLVSSTGTYTLTGISSDAVKNYPIVALPQSYLVGATGLDYFSTRRLEASTAPFVMTLQSNGDFFWYQTTQTIPIIKPRLTNRNQWILGRATHMGRRGL